MAEKTAEGAHAGSLPTGWAAARATALRA
jgi:hypothetical protein